MKGDLFPPSQSNRVRIKNINVWSRKENEKLFKNIYT